MTRRQSPLVPSAKIPPIRIHFWPRAFRLPENFRREIQARGQDADVVVIVVVRAYVGGEDVVYPEYRYSNRELREAFSTYHRPIRSPASRYSLSVRRNERSRLFIPGKFSPQIVASIATLSEVDCFFGPETLPSEIPRRWQEERSRSREKKGGCEHRAILSNIREAFDLEVRGRQRVTKLQNSRG